MPVHVKLYPITNNLVDVFLGDGWEHWSRWFIRRDGFFTHIAGEKSTPLHKKSILDTLKTYKEPK